MLALATPAFWDVLRLPHRLSRLAWAPWPEVRFSHLAPTHLFSVHVSQMPGCAEEGHSPTEGRGQSSAMGSTAGTH